MSFTVALFQAYNGPNAALKLSSSNWSLFSNSLNLLVNNSIIANFFSTLSTSVGVITVERSPDPQKNAYWSETSKAISLTDTIYSGFQTNNPTGTPFTVDLTRTIFHELVHAKYHDTDNLISDKAAYQREERTVFLENTVYRAAFGGDERVGHGTVALPSASAVSYLDGMTLAEPGNANVFKFTSGATEIIKNYNNYNVSVSASSIYQYDHYISVILKSSSRLLFENGVVDNQKLTDVFAGVQAVDPASALDTAGKTILSVQTLRESLAIGLAGTAAGSDLLGSLRFFTLDQTAFQAVSAEAYADSYNGGPYRTYYGAASINTTTAPDVLAIDATALTGAIIVGGSGYNKNGINALDGGDDIKAGGGNDLLLAGNSRGTRVNLLDGGAGHDILIGGTGRDQLTGGDGDDLMLGGGGEDVFKGGAGKDIVSYTTASAGVSVDLSLRSGAGDFSTVVGLATAGAATDATGDKMGGIEIVIGSSYNDVLKGDGTGVTLFGAEGDDELFGKSNDILIGGAGRDTLHDGEGNSILSGGEGSDLFIGGPGSDDIWGGDEAAPGSPSDEEDTVSYSSGTKPVTISYDGSSETTAIRVGDGSGGTDALHSIEKIIGTAGRDVVNIVGQIAAGTNLTIDGGGGQGSSPQDTINFSKSTVGGAVTLDGAGSGTISTGANQFIHLTGFHTGIVGSNFDDNVTDTSTGHKNIDGGGGNDVISIAGTTGTGTLLGGFGDDVLTGGSGNDILNGGSGADHLFGGAGSDLLISRDHSEAFSTEVLDGGEGSDKLVAAGNVDGAVILRGGGGNDLFHSTASSLSGNGAVVVEFGVGAGHDEVIGTPVESSIDAPGGIAWNIAIDASSLSRDDVKIVWTPNVISQNGDIYEIRGDLALVIKSTGDSILFGDVTGFRRPAPGTSITDPVHWDNYTSGSIWGIDLPYILFSDGDEIFIDGITLVDFDMSGAGSYDQAAADYAGAIALPAGSQDGGDGADDLSGAAGDDTLSGGGGDDNFEGSAGNDTIDGGTGNDTLNLFGARGDYEVTENGPGEYAVTDLRDGAITTITNVENIYFIYNNEAAPVEDLFPIIGTAGDDNPLSGTPFDDQIEGWAGDDVIIAGGGNDRVTGGAGTDTIVEGSGDDTYFWNLGDGDDVITGGSASDGSDTLEFGPGITVDSLRYSGTPDGWGIKVWIEGDAGSITLDRLLDSGNRQIDQFRFADGSLLSRSQILAAAFSQIPTAGADHIYGSQGDDIIGGLAGDDIIDSRGGDDILAGGVGSDRIDGGDGIDAAYYFGASTDFGIALAPDGSVEVWDTLGDEGYDVLSGVEVLHFAGDGATIMVSGLPPLGSLVDDTIVGTARSETLYGFEGNDRLEGSGGADTLVGGIGADLLLGQIGADTLIGGDGDDMLTGGADDDIYRIAPGEGSDIIDDYGDGSGGSGGTDTLLLDVGITPGDVTVTQEFNGSGFVLEFAGTSDIITLRNSLPFNEWRIELVRFEDGTIWSHADLLAKSMERNGGDDVFYGDENGQIIDGGLGSDQLIGRAGNDVLIGGAGNDSLWGEAGNDTYLFSLGGGQDIIEDWRSPSNFNTLQFTAEIAPEDVVVGTDASGFDITIEFLNSSDSVTIKYMNIANNGINQILFADGTVWSDADILGLAQGGGSMAQATTAFESTEVQMQLPDASAQTVSAISDADRLAEAAGSFGAKFANARTFAFDGFEARLWGGQPDVVYLSRHNNDGAGNFDALRQ
ncbi:hypothetical protein FPZ54_02840 [Sphingomonas suaedae]|uniref:Haemolysin-type calcium binding-related domain-containing protein n=1 Tax=Sphingomonas suaedae TaxID=2599297 RepID=A0A518RC88_9SPHN|nr:calcium-binding protein [Sphingomonas suaedae]QDX25065.1 hypothetical protein FPZ54_02840 [Sphingomonas suaedae]